MKVLTVAIKNFPTTVVKMKIGDLEKRNLSNKAIALNFDKDYEVYVRCDEKGNIVYRSQSKKDIKKYSIHEIARCPVLESHKIQELKKDGVRRSLIKTGVSKLIELGFTEVTKENILEEPNKNKFIEIVQSVEKTTEDEEVRNIIHDFEKELQ